MPILYASDRFQLHQTGRHVEIPDRTRMVGQVITDTGLRARFQEAEFQVIADEELKTIHRPEVIRAVREIAASGGGRLDPDTVVSSGSFEVGKLAAGAARTAVDKVITGSDYRAFCLVRPPGHHATPMRSMGFCLFNTVALAAKRALDEHGLERVLIVDFDVHHGNGTQDCFWDDGRVTFLSIHRYGFGFYPGTGAADETGTGDGLGHTVNVPVEFGTPVQEYHDLFERALERTAEMCKPELVLISAGFDAHADDPIGSLGLTAEDFRPLTRKTLAIADSYSGGRVVSCLEGGYNLAALADSVRVHLEVMLDD